MKTWYTVEVEGGYVSATYTEANKMQVKHEKLSGDEFNYDLVRYPWTPLDAKEIAYCLYDVIGLCEALEKEMEIDGDNLYTIPSTSTGYKEGVKE